MIKPAMFADALRWRRACRQMLEEDDDNIVGAIKVQNLEKQATTLELSIAAREPLLSLASKRLWWLRELTRLRARLGRWQAAKASPGWNALPGADWTDGLIKDPHGACRSVVHLHCGARTPM